MYWVALQVSLKRTSCRQPVLQFPGFGRGPHFLADAAALVECACGGAASALGKKRALEPVRAVRGRIVSARCRSKGGVKDDAFVLTSGLVRDFT